MFLNTSQSRYRREQTRVVIGGIVFLIIMLLCSIAMLGLYASWFQSLKDQESSHESVDRLSVLLDALDAETEEFLLTGAVETATSDAVLAALSSGSFEFSVADFQGAKTATSKISTHAALIELATQATYRTLHSNMPERLQSSLDLFHHTAVSYHEQQTSDIIAAMNHAGTTASASFLNQLGISSASSKAYKYLSSEAMETQLYSTPGLSEPYVAKLLPSGLSYSTTPSQPKIQDSTLQLNQTIRLVESAASGTSGTPSDGVLTTLIINGVTVGITLICIGLSVVVTLRYTKSTKRARSLVESFGSKTAMNEVNSVYRPILQHMQLNPEVDRSEGLNNEVLREFNSVATMAETLRPLLPQALFGELSGQQRDGNGSWSLNKQPLRLEMGMSFTKCTIMTVMISFARSSNSNFAVTPEGARMLMSDVTTALQLITKTANDHGGILLSVSTGGVVSCAWNATNVVDKPALQALKAARLIDTMFSKVNLDINISTGNCIISNTKIGERKHVTMVGTPFDISERLLLLNEVHDARLIMDYDTFKELPREDQKECKPVVVLRIRDETMVVYSADLQPDLKNAQWKHYSSAFTLYQNNMISESLAEFRKYLLQYPNDSCARFIVDEVLSNRATAKRKISYFGGAASMNMLNKSGNDIADAQTSNL